MERQLDTPLTHPLTRRVATLTTEQSARNCGHFRSYWETTLRGQSPDIRCPAPGMGRRTP